MKLLKYSLLVILLTLTQTVRAEILFEGYYKVTQFKKHIGFLVLRHEIDDKTKDFKSTSFIKLAKGGFDLTETYTAVSDQTFLPLSLTYLSAGDKKTKTIDAKIKNGKMTGLVVEDGKKIKLDSAIPKGAFFSSALYYLMLQSKDGLKTDTKFDFVGITEEGPVPLDGTVSVDKKMVTVGSNQLMKVSNKFAGSEYDNLISSRGEVYSAVTPATSIETELVKNPEDAMSGIKLPSGTLEKIFGSKPAGKQNSFYSKTN
ncbi:MAG: hypothetical protein ACXVAX_01620 [Pseudobdellovibrio sp.]